MLHGGADPGYSFRGGGGGRKSLCAHTHNMSAKPEVLYGRGQGPWKLLGVLMLSCAILALFFKHYNTK